jgi:hypothetical protein
MGGFNRIYNLPELRKEHEVYRTYEVGKRGAVVLAEMEVQRLLDIEEEKKEQEQLVILQQAQNKKDAVVKDELDFQKDVAAKHSFKQLKNIRLKVEQDILNDKRSRHDRVRARLAKFQINDNVQSAKQAADAEKEADDEREVLYQQFGNAAVKKRANDKLEKQNKLAKKIAHAHQKAIKDELALGDLKTRLHIPESERLVRPKRAIQRKLEAEDIRKRMKKKAIHLPACYAKQTRRSDFNDFVRNEDGNKADKYIIKSTQKRMRVRRRDVKSLQVNLSPTKKKRGWFFRTLLSKSKSLPSVGKGRAPSNDSDSDEGEYSHEDESDSEDDDRGKTSLSRRSPSQSPGAGSPKHMGAPVSFVHSLKDRKVVPIDRLKDEHLKWDDERKARKAAMKVSGLQV